MAKPVGIQVSKTFLMKKYVKTQPKIKKSGSVKLKWRAITQEDVISKVTTMYTSTFMKLVKGIQMPCQFAEEKVSPFLISLNNCKDIM